MLDEEMTKVMKDFLRLMNNFGITNDDVIDAMVKEFLCEHNTIEQNFCRCLYTFFKKVAERDIYTDPRNEASFKWIKKVAEIDHHFPFV